MGSKLLYSLPALLLALLALILAVVGLSQNSTTRKAATSHERQQAAQSAKAFHYWVITKPLKAGDTLSADQLAVVSSPTAIPDAVSSDTKVAGRKVEHYARPGELLSKTFFEGGGSLPTALPPGQRAMAIKVDDVSGAGGLLRPGDSVDVVTAFRQSEDKKGPAALVMLHRIRVLAVHGELTRETGKKDENRRRNDTVVLAVPKEKIPELLLASSEGKIRLAVVARQENDRIADAAHEGDAGTKAGASLGPGKPPAETVAANDQSAAGGDADDGKTKPFYFNDFFPAEQKPAPAVHHRPRGYRVQVFEGAETRSTYVR